LFCNVNLTWLNLYSNVVSNDYTFITTNKIIYEELVVKV
jgi:hypothetical protein